jgi:hypothetical protein
LAENTSANDYDGDISEEENALWENYFEAVMDAKLRAQALIGTGPPTDYTPAAATRHQIIIN